MNLEDRYYKPYNVGKKLFEQGYGISDIIGAVKCDQDMEEAFTGYIEAMKQKESKEIRNKLTLGNV